MPPHSCLTMFPEHYFLVHPSVFPQASECHPSGSCDASCNARANTLLQQCCALPSPKNQGGGYVVPQGKGLPTPPLHRTGRRHLHRKCGVHRRCGGHHRTCGAPPPLMTSMVPTLVTHRPPRWRPYPAHHCPVPHPPAPVCTTGQGVGTPPVPSLYSVPLHRLWRRRCAAACGGAPPGVSTPPHAAQVAPPTAVCAHMCILKQVQKGLKKQPFS